MWGGHLVRPAYVAGKMPAPQDGIIYFLEIPKYQFLMQKPLV
ncbi:hypothetical protein FDUTEX481_00400 [Tolypothrix sp. PCC 7601]|nr:hypothetical protein FDUTEX481_00400 [Tolypothrix sp. PCC 7601]